jgi:hypothetical protein
MSYDLLDLGVEGRERPDNEAGTGRDHRPADVMDILPAGRAMDGAGGCVCFGFEL